MWNLCERIDLVRCICWPSQFPMWMRSLWRNDFVMTAKIDSVKYIIRPSQCILFFSLEEMSEPSPGTSAEAAESGDPGGGAASASRKASTSSKRLKSPLWKHFTPSDDPSKAVCNHCRELVMNDYIYHVRMTWYFPLGCGIPSH